MNCRHCQRKLNLLDRWRSEYFCSPACKRAYQEEDTRLTRELIEEMNRQRQSPSSFEMPRPQDLLALSEPGIHDRPGSRQWFDSALEAGRAAPVPPQYSPGEHPPRLEWAGLHLLAISTPNTAVFARIDAATEVFRTPPFLPGTWTLALSSRSSLPGSSLLPALPLYPCSLDGHRPVAGLTPFLQRLATLLPQLRSRNLARRRNHIRLRVRALDAPTFCLPPPAGRHIGQ